MREIKFRAWDAKWKRMYMPKDTILQSWVGEEGWEIERYFANGDHAESVAVDGKTVVLMQYTGLKDKNGKEIYEGDIVHYRYNVGNKKGEWEYDCDGLISWKSTGFHIGPLGGQGWLSAWLIACPGLYGNDEKETYGPNELLEVIGNIHENPELLKDVKS